jgi:hypothetical protein
VPQTEYTMNRNSKYYYLPCGRCEQRIRVGRKYDLDPVVQVAGLPVVYHAGCYRVAVRKQEQKS